MSTAMTGCWRIAATLLAGMISLGGASRALADAGVILLEHATSINGDFVAESKVVDSQDAMLFRVTERLRNDSGAAWTGIRIGLVTHDGNTGNPRAAVRSDGINFDANTPGVDWTNAVEVRVNGRYLGPPGGVWRVTRNEPTTEAAIQFFGLSVKPGDELDVRIRVSDGAPNIWKMVFTAIPERHPRLYWMWAGAGLAGLGALMLALGRRAR